MDFDTHLSGAPGPMRKSVAAVLIATVLLATLVTSLTAQRYFVRVETEAAANRMVLYLRTLNETLRQHQHLPFVLARDPRYSDLLNPTTVGPEVSEQLRLLAEQAKLEAIYLMDGDGLVLASSNANEPHSFLGQNYGFRPYFQESLTGQRSDYFAIGATSGRPGYFVAEPVSLGQGTQRGVMAIKLDVSELQRSWESVSDTIVAINKDGIIVLASDPSWLYRPINELDPALRSQILESRQFGAQPLKPLSWTFQNDGRVTVEGTNYVLASGQSDWRQWTVHYLQPEATITRQTLTATALFGSIIALLVGFATFLRSRRIALAYTASERQRRQLVEANSQLEQTQTELASNAKLAALGQLAASVTHELGQPISAFRNHLAAAEIGNEITSPKTANSLNKLVDRMESIISQFRYFARGRRDEKTPVSLATILEEALHLLDGEIKAAAIDVDVKAPPTEMKVKAHKIQLEQGFMNLLKNAVQAVEDTEHPQIRIDVVAHSRTAEIRITDSGPGLAGASLSDLQEPFFSTKPSGVGMGLGLAITSEIITDHGGEISLGSTETGAEFIVMLPLWRESEDE